MSYAWGELVGGSATIAENDKPAIADAIWDEVASDHETSDSFGSRIETMFAKLKFIVKEF